jgi:hypothetical protein
MVLCFKKLYQLGLKRLAFAFLNGDMFYGPFLRCHLCGVISLDVFFYQVFQVLLMVPSFARCRYVCHLFKFSSYSDCDYSYLMGKITRLLKSSQSY